ncbi:unnamed protein product [Adineta ricciae]|uniref:G-protein coupled receptors family 1 profile domain-containing protein n=1 Tax=Adineta ricciae TaxID=249248 RepID=A0A813SXP0_ADIRI|nr:unnamed protein product [Adineta ricciae]CAF1474146.1 unnamed protein product [Adineta ricciae]
MIILEIPAILLSIVILVYFVLDRQARSKLKNHGWIVLLLSNFLQLIINLPMPMSYYYRGTVWPQTNSYCTWWATSEFSFNSIGLFLMAWISIERHFIVFHSHTFLQGYWRKCLFHVFPIILCLILSPVFFFVFIVISPLCTSDWDFGLLGCGAPCYYGEYFLNQFDFYFNLLVPTFIIVLANVMLVVRVIHQKVSRQRIIHWRQHRRMILQLWIISSLYVAFWLPVSITLLVQITADPSFMMHSLAVMQFLTYLIPLLLPMMCLSTLPELTKKILRKITNSRSNVVEAMSGNRNVRVAIAITRI